MTSVHVWVNCDRRCRLWRLCRNCWRFSRIHVIFYAVAWSQLVDVPLPCRSSWVDTNVDRTGAKNLDDNCWDPNVAACCVWAHSTRHSMVCQQSTGMSWLPTVCLFPAGTWSLLLLACLGPYVQATRKGRLACCESGDHIEVYWESSQSSMVCDGTATEIIAVLLSAAVTTSVGTA